MTGKMLLAEVQAASTIAAIRLRAADIREPAVNDFVAIRMIANGRHAVTDVALPVAVISDGPAHHMLP